MSILPHHNKIRVLISKKDHSNKYLRSVWYGLTQGPLNYPRMVIGDLFVGLRVAVVGLIVGIAHILLLAILRPVLCVLAVFFLGLAGRLTLEDEEGEVRELSPMFDKRVKV